MSDRGGIDPERVERWVANAKPGQEEVYAWGSPDFPRSLAAVKVAQRLAGEGLLTFTSRRPSPGRVEYVMRRTAKRRLDEAAKREAGYAPPTTATGFLLAILRRAAASGRPCPTDAELDLKLEAAGYADRAPYVMRKLRENGQIRSQVYGPGKRRVVTIVRSGLRTAMENPA